MSKYDFSYNGTYICTSDLSGFMNSILPQGWTVFGQSIPNTSEVVRSTDYSVANFNKLFKPFGWRCKPHDGSIINNNAPGLTPRVTYLENQVQIHQDALEKQTATIEKQTATIQDQANTIQEMARAVIKIVMTIREGFVNEEEWRTLHQIAGADFDEPEAPLKAPEFEA